MPVPWLTRVIEALGTTDPELSRAVPRTSAVSNCANSGAAVKNRTIQLFFIAFQNSDSMIISGFIAMNIRQQTGCHPIVWMRDVNCSSMKRLLPFVMLASGAFAQTSQLDAHRGA